MVKRIDLTGRIIGELKVISYYKDKKWLCKCSCGNERLIYSSSLRNGKSHCGCKGIKFPTKSCGCLNSIDLKGKVFGRLTVEKDSGKRTTSGGNIIWETRCNCGNTKLCSSSHLIQGHSTHCGCQIIERRKELESLRIRNILSTYRGSARSRGIEFKLTKNDVEKIIDLDCFYCGSTPLNEKYIHPLKGETEKRKIVYQGIDRIDSNIGYTEKNIIPCCKTCNLMKRDMSQKEFIDHITKILKN